MRRRSLMSPIYSFVHPAESGTKGGKWSFAAVAHSQHGAVKADLDQQVSPCFLEKPTLEW